MHSEGAAFGIRPMIKVTEYEKHAAECRRLAAQTNNPAHRIQLEEMAQAWEALARDRANQVLNGITSQGGETPLNGEGAKVH
jgi:hypothetical protein